MPEIPPIISVDDHVIEPPHLWQEWLPARYRDRGPRVVRSPYEMVPQQGWPFRPAASGPMTDWWIYEDLRYAVVAGMASAGRAPEEIGKQPVSYDEMRPGFYEPKARLDDMDINHVERSLCFPTFPRFCGQTFHEAKDKDLALACVHAYNDWMVDEWCGHSGGRLIPLCLIPLWDLNLAAAEVQRNAARGVRAVAFSELPYRLGLPSVHDRERRLDPFLAACEDTGTVLCIHIGSSSQFLNTSDDAPSSVRMAITTTNAQMSMADWLLSGVLARFPRLKLAFSESQIGWMPFLFERMDRIWQEGNAMSGIPPEMTEPPSSYVAGRVFGCFFADDFGLAVRDHIGIDQITFESDYPHQDTTWPNTRAYAEHAMGDLSQDEVDKVVRGNAMRMLELEETVSSSSARR
jgi:predicted TIM-barrel fold metal-dependent hydrolase